MLPMQYPFLEIHPSLPTRQIPLGQNLVIRTRLRSFIPWITLFLLQPSPRSLALPFSHGHPRPLFPKAQFNPLSSTRLRSPLTWRRSNCGSFSGTPAKWWSVWSWQITRVGAGVLLPSVWRPRQNVTGLSVSFNHCNNKAVVGRERKFYDSPLSYVRTTVPLYIH